MRPGYLLRAPRLAVLFFAVLFFAVLFFAADRAVVFLPPVFFFVLVLLFVGIGFSF
jgi:hypothetical protein